jgi:hypothetical protein
MARAVGAAKDISAAALLVHAIDREAVPFYVQLRFSSFRRRIADPLSAYAHHYRRALTKRDSSPLSATVGH